jgi:hypothetical protein
MKSSYLYYTEGEKNIRGLNFIRKSASSSGYGEEEAIKNILQYSGDIKDIAINIEYVPWVDFKARQFKTPTDPFAEDSSLFYNQQANEIDIDAYGENMFFALSRTGNVKIGKTQYFEKLEKCPQCGQFYLEDGEKYIAQALSKGAFAISHNKLSGSIQVEDTSDALLKVASLYKEKTNVSKTIAITGSVGKSTTVRFLKRILSTCLGVHSPIGNFNNHLGVPYTVFNIQENSTVLITELGMNHENEISALSKCVSPDISVITSIGSSHIGNFGSREKIARAKLEILDGMTGGYVLVPYEEELLANIGTGGTNPKVVANKLATIYQKQIKSTIETPEIHSTISLAKPTEKQISLKGLNNILIKFAN